MANEPLKLLLNKSRLFSIIVAEMFMANEPLKPSDDDLEKEIETHVAEMFMANEPLKPVAFIHREL